MSAHWTEKQPILPAGTHPLPFVQVGMQLRVAGRIEQYGALVQDVYEEELTGWSFARLVGNGTGRSMIVRCSELRRCYALLSDFDPNLPDEAG